MTTISPRRMLSSNQVATLRASLEAAVAEVGEAEGRNHSSEWAVQHLAQQLEKEKQARKSPMDGSGNGDICGGRFCVPLPRMSLTAF